jgi:hypothetical protein
VAAGFFPPHHAGEDCFRIEILSTAVDKRGGVGSKNTWNKPCAHLRAAGVAAGRVESKAANRLPVTNDVGDHGDHRCRHFGEIEARIGELRFERNRRLSNIDDTHRAG